MTAVEKTRMKIKGPIYIPVRDKELNSKYVGNLCRENFRTKTSKDGKIFQQGLGLEGIIKALYLNRCTGQIIAKFSLHQDFRYCELKWVSVINTGKEYY